MEEMRNWKEAFDRLGVQSELEGRQGLRVGRSRFEEELKGIDPTSDLGCDKLAAITDIPLAEIRRVLQQCRLV